MFYLVKMTTDNEIRKNIQKGKKLIMTKTQHDIKTVLKTMTTTKNYNNHHKQYKRNKIGKL